MCCLLLKKGVKKNASPIVMSNFIVHFWDHDLNDHFASEEDLLLRLGSTFTGLQQPLKRMDDEHLALKGMVRLIKEGSSLKRIAQFKENLEKHIRFEEQVLFPLIENTIDNKLLIEIGEKLALKEQAKNCLHYPVKFWE